MTLAIYPGSFDPITYGHLNLVDRTLKLFDKLIIAIARNVQKPGFFSVPERIEMLEKALEGKSNVHVESFDGLLVNYAMERKASAIVRGLRAVADFEFEFQMAHMNRHLSSIETVFLMTGEEHFYVSSQLVREVAMFGGSVKGLVPPHVVTALKNKIKK